MTPWLRNIVLATGALGAVVAAAVLLLDSCPGGDTRVIPPPQAPQTPQPQSDIIAQTPPLQQVAPGAGAGART